MTYSQLSAKAMAAPNNAALAGQVATVFKGTTLRGMLLSAYGFWEFGQIAWIGAIASFAGAALLLLLLLLSLVAALRLRIVPETTEIFPRISHPGKVPATV